jgi:hypothetical protein
MHTLVEFFFCNLSTMRLQVSYATKNVICNYFLVAYNTFSCIKKSIYKKISSNVCWAKTRSLYISSQEKQ